MRGVRLDKGTGQVLGGVKYLQSRLGRLFHEDPHRASYERAGNFISLAFITSEVEEPQASLLWIDKDVEYVRNK